MIRKLRSMVEGQKPVIAKPEDKVLAVAKRLKAAKVGAAPVAVKGRLVGIFTERDLLTRVVAGGKDAKKVTVGDVMTKDVEIASPNLTVLEALEAMRRHKCRHLPVVDGGVLRGIVSQRDCITVILQMKDEEIEDLKNLLDMIPVEPGVG
jgi:CBS domain-containing protein